MAAVLCRAVPGLAARGAASCPRWLRLQTASYNPRPLRLDLGSLYVPDHADPRTPQWQKTARYQRKLFGRGGSASGVDPESLWPGAEQLELMVAEEQQWHPPLDTMLRDLEAKERQETEKRLAREKLIADNMAKMPQMIAEWRFKKREAKLKERTEKARREQLLFRARERFGYNVDPRSPKFLEMVEELEKEEKKKKKLLKRKLKEEQVTAASVKAPAPSSASE